MRLSHNFLCLKLKRKQMQAKILQNNNKLYTEASKIKMENLRKKRQTPTKFNGRRRVCDCTLLEKKMIKNMFSGETIERTKQFTITLILSHSSRRGREKTSKCFGQPNKPKKTNARKSKQTRVERQQTNQEEGEKSCVKVVEENRT